jgi:hypothetical protein
VIRQVKKSMRDGALAGWQNAALRGLASQYSSSHRMGRSRSKLDQMSIYATMACMLTCSCDWMAMERPSAALHCVSNMIMILTHAVSCIGAEARGHITPIRAFLELFFRRSRPHALFKPMRTDILRQSEAEADQSPACARPGGALEKLGSKLEPFKVGQVR